MQNKKVKFFKIILLIIFMLIMILLTIRLYPIFKGIATEEGRIEFKSKTESLGFEGIFIIIGLMIVQIFLPILPRRTC